VQVIVLGSTSKYRANLLSRLGLSFITSNPLCDETPRADEPPENLAIRLARDKAHSLRKAHPDSIIIGSDQVAALKSDKLGKPGTAANAKAQLLSMRGHAVDFYTGVCVLDAASGNQFQAMDRTTATLRHLSTEEIERYVEADKPMDCAGSFKVESLGISLFERVETQDPTALIGLPLIQLSQILRKLGLSVP